LKRQQWILAKGGVGPRQEKEKKKSPQEKAASKRKSAKKPQLRTDLKKNLVKAGRGYYAIDSCR